MLVPTIHTNGTAPAELLDQIRTAIRALGRARETLHDAFPNARDYYPQGEAAFMIATTEWTARVEQVRDVERELHEIAASIEQQVKPRVRR